jgi:hypothetical protein
MSHRIDHLAITLLVSIGIALLPHAAGAMPGGGGGGGGGGSMAAPQRQQTPEQRAAKSYEKGERARDRALAYEEKARESDEKGFLGLGARPSEKAEKQWRKSADAFQKAARTSPGRYSKAYADVCVAYRELGELEESLAAADRALKTVYEYPPAIACRAETLLELGRLAEAKKAWESLNSRDRQLAGELLQRMEAWLDRNDREPADLPGESLEDFRAWMRESGGLARR